jgi:hypothetical protein
MNGKLRQAITGGLVATIAFTLMTFIAPLMGMPKMSPPEMLAMMMGVPIMAGWIMHFIIGVIFALVYDYFFIDILKKIQNLIVKGVVFGIIIFIVAQIMIPLMGLLFHAAPMMGNKTLMMVGSLVGHVVFGIVVALMIKLRQEQKQG